MTIVVEFQESRQAREDAVSEQQGFLTPFSVWDMGDYLLIECSWVRLIWKETEDYCRWLQGA